MALSKKQIEIVERKLGVKVKHIKKDVYALYRGVELLGFYRIREASYNWEVKPPREKFDLSSQTVLAEPGDASYAYRYTITKIDTEGMRKKLAEMILDDHRVQMYDIIDVAYKILESLYGFLIFDDEEE